jgi:hypothetical protein
MRTITGTKISRIVGENGEYLAELIVWPDGRWDLHGNGQRALEYVRNLDFTTEELILMVDDEDRDQE